MRLSVWDKDAETLITSESPLATHITIILDGKIFWDGKDMSNNLELKIN